MARSVNHTLKDFGLALLSLVSLVSVGHGSEEVITRDVAIIGGGSSGTYAAVRLRDQGKSVIVIEKENVMGGHTNTYHDPFTNQTVDYGVIVFHDQQVVKSYFDRLNVSYLISSVTDGSSNTIYLDVHTAGPIKYTSPDVVTGLEAYYAQLEKYHDLELGFFLPDPVPDDLLLPFGQFVAKYPEIGNAIYLIFSYGQGLGDFLNQPTLYVFKNFGLDIIQDIASGFVVTKSNDNHEVYAHARKLLGEDVLLRSHVVSTEQRDNNGIKLTVKTPGVNKIIHAKKLLIAIPQKLNNLIPFDLDGNETSTFSEFINTGYYTSLVRNTGLPNTFNMASLSPNTPFNIPQMPGVYDIVPSGIPDLFDIKYGSPHSVPDEYVQKEIIDYIKKLQANGFTNNVTSEPEFVRFKSHAPFELTVSPGAIQAGFYKDLYALQGYRNTYYTGAAFHTQDSSMLWNFTESYVLPDLLK
jgi:hypothetical protein